MSTRSKNPVPSAAPAHARAPALANRVRDYLTPPAIVVAPEQDEDVHGASLFHHDLGWTTRPAGVQCERVHELLFAEREADAAATTSVVDWVVSASARVAAKRDTLSAVCDQIGAYAPEHGGTTGGAHRFHPVEQGTRRTYGKTLAELVRMLCRLEADGGDDAGVCGQFEATPQRRLQRCAR